MPEQEIAALFDDIFDREGLNPETTSEPSTTSRPAKCKIEVSTSEDSISIKYTAIGGGGIICIQISLAAIGILIKKFKPDFFTNSLSSMLALFKSSN